MTEGEKPVLGFVGQGYVGKNYADEFEGRDFTCVRYALEEPYVENKDKIADCDIVFIGVPTPSTPNGFDDSIVRAAVALVSPGKSAVIKSTIVPGTTADIQKQYPDRFVFYSPEFLSEVTAAEDVRNPFSNIVGVATDDVAHREAAERILALLPRAPFSRIMTSTEAELVKYTHNGSGYMQIIFFNLMYDLAQKVGASWEPIESATRADPYVCNRYARPVHKSGRGAGGHCFIKDVAALRELYERATGDALGTAVLKAAEAENRKLLTESGKDLDLLKGVYGTA